MNAIGLRIKDVRKRAGMTQQDLADYCGVSRPAVAQWEIGSTHPSTGRLIKVANALNVDPAYLLGSNFFIDPDKEVSVIGGRQLLIIDFQGATRAAERTLQRTDTQILITDQPVGQDGFALIVKDRSMVPDFEVGDKIIIDPEVAPRPGDIVVAHVFGEDEAVLRKCRPRSAEGAENPEFELAPLNQDWPTGHINADSPGTIIGTVVEQRRYRDRSK